MDQLNALGAIGLGLSAAGGALNQDVYNQNVNIQTQQTAQDAKRKEFLADLLTKHYQAGTLTGPAYQQAMGKLGFDIPTPGATPDYSGPANAVTSKLDQGGYLGGGSGGGLGGQGGQSPAQPPVQLAGAPPGPAQFGGGTALAGGGGVVGGAAGYGATGSEVPGAAQNIPPVAAAPAPTPAPAAAPDQSLAQVEITGKKTSVYGVDEINQATADYAKSISGQPGTIQAKQKAVKDFRDSLKAERKSQLDELNKESEVKKRDNDIQISQRDRFRTPLLNNLDALAKMDKSDPRYAPLKAAIDKETATGEADTNFTKELKQHLKASGLTEGTADYNAKFAEFTKAHLDKMDAPSSTTLNTNAANEMSQDDIDYLAKQSIAGDPSVMAGYSRAPQVRMRIQSAAIRIAKEQGYTPEHLAVMKAEYKGMEAAQRTAGTREAQLGFAVSELSNFVPLASQASDKVPRVAFKPINQLMQAGENQWSPEQAAFVAANRSVVNAFAQVASRGVPTVHSTEEAEKMLNTAQSHDAYKAVLKQLQLEARAAQNAPKDVRKDLSDHIENRGKGPRTQSAPVQAAPATAGVPSIDDLLNKYPMPK